MLILLTITLKPPAVDAGCFDKTPLWIELQSVANGNYTVQCSYRRTIIRYSTPAGGPGGNQYRRTFGSPTTCKPEPAASRCVTLVSLSAAGGSGRVFGGRGREHVTFLMGDFRIFRKAGFGWRPLILCQSSSSLPSNPVRFKLRQGPHVSFAPGSQGRGDRRYPRAKTCPSPCFWRHNP